MNRILLIVISLTITRTFVIGQIKASSSWNSKSGLIVFEGRDSSNVYEMYFVETSIKTLKSLMKIKDTLFSITLGSPGDAANDASGFKWYLDKRKVKFKIDQIVVRDTNYLGYNYEDTTMLYSAYGTVQYSRSKSSLMSLRTKQLYYNNKIVSICSNYFVPINSFTPALVCIYTN